MFKHRHLLPLRFDMHLYSIPYCLHLFNNSKEEATTEEPQTNYILHAQYNPEKLSNFENLYIVFSCQQQAVTTNAK